MCGAALYQLCFMSTFIAVFGCDGKIFISFVIIFLCQLYLQLRDLSISFKWTSIVCFDHVTWIHVHFVLCQLPLQFLDALMKYISICFMSTSIARFAHVTWIHIHFVLCQLPLQFLDALMKYISILSHVNFHCTLCPC